MTRMELYHLQSFVAVAAAGGIREAARRLNLTPPTISGHIKTLEDEFSIPLFNRNPRGMALTPRGGILLKQAEKIIDATRNFQHRVAELRGIRPEPLNLGLNAPSDFLKIPQLALGMKPYPYLNLCFHPSSTGKIIDDLLAERLDAGYVFAPLTGNGIASFYLHTFDLCIAVPEALQPRTGTIGWTEIARMPWIVTDGYCPFQTMADALFEARGLTLSNRVCANDERTRLDLVRHGVGVSLLLTEECRTDVLSGKIIPWNRDPIPCELYFACLAGRQNDPALSLLLNAVRSLWSDRP